MDLAHDSMGTCDYCGTDTTETYHDNIDSALHRSCHDEMKRRRERSLCTFCGETLGPDEIEIGDVKHENCRIQGTYSGYPYQ